MYSSNPSTLSSDSPLRRRLITSSSPEQQLCRAIKNIDEIQGLEQVRQLVEEENADISRLFDNYWTPLTLAAHLGKTDIVSFLLACIGKMSTLPASSQKWRTTVDSINDKGESALICAARQGHAQICRFLLEAGSDANFRSHFSGQTALLVAVEAKEMNVVDLLLELGADVQVSDNVGITPLYAAVRVDSVPIVQRLIQAGCDVDVGSQDHAPLFLAARKGLLSIAQILCEAGCYKDISNKYGVTPLYEAALKGENTVLQYLVAQGCDIHKYDMYNVSPLQAAVLMGNTQGVRILVQAGACIRWRNSQGKCAVQLSLELGKVDILEFFLTLGIDVCKRPNLTFSDMGRMPLLQTIFEQSLMSSTMLLVLRGCSRLDLHALNHIGSFRSHPILLELAFTSGLSEPPTNLLTQYSLNDFEPECRQWLQQFKSVPQTLKNLARCSIRQSLGNTILHSAPKLPLPTLLVDYIIYKDAVIE